MRPFLSILSISLILFLSCQKGLTETQKKEYLAKGKQIAKTTANHLGGELTKHMKAGGVSEAIPYCNGQAGLLTQEMSEKFKVAIKRTSHKLRNSNNAPTANEIAILEQFKELKATNTTLKPVVALDGKGHPHFYAPIIVQKKCLACHGVIGDSMKPATDSIIKTLYPKDKATGFHEGDLRGIWSIAFESK